MKSIKNLLIVFLLATLTASSVLPNSVSAQTRNTSTTTGKGTPRPSSQPAITCEDFQAKLILRAEALEKMERSFPNHFNQVVIKLKALLTNLEEKGYPIDLINKVRADIEKLSPLVDAVIAEIPGALAKEQSILTTLDCKTNPDIKVLKKEVQLANVPLKEDLLALLTFIKNTLKPDISALKDAKPEVSTQ